MKQDRTCDIVGDIRDDRVVVVWGCILEYILMMDRYGSSLHESVFFSGDLWHRIFSHEPTIEKLDHIWVELDEIECRWMVGEDILCECTIPRSYFDDMTICYGERAGDICQSFFVDEEVLSEGFFGFYSFLHNLRELS
jgi:hypothetical protein